jgi:hypothetical protein
MGLLESEKEQNFPQVICVEPAKIPIEGVLSARALSQVEPSGNDVTSQNDHVKAGRRRGYTCIMLANFIDETLIIPRATILGVAEEVLESLVDKINLGKETNPNELTMPSRKCKDEALHDKLLRGNLDQLSQEERQHIEPVLLWYAHVFHERKRTI